MSTKKEKTEQENAAPATAAEADPVEEARKQAQAIIDAAKAEAAKIVGHGKAEATPAPKDDGEELVPIRLFKDNDKYKDDVFVAVNGRRFQIKRGETVKVPRYIADVLEQSMKQDEATANLITRQSEEYAAEAKSRGL